MIDLSERQKLILSLVVRDYVESAEPVSSKQLVEHFNLDFSTATVRNELAALTDLGYLRQPHTSAGRVPTESGYRYFVERLLGKANLPSDARSMIRHQFYQMRHDMEEWMRLAASLLAQYSQSASLVTAPHSERARLKHLELISTHGRQVLVVMVLTGGELHQRLVTLDEPPLQEMLSATAAQLTALLHGLTVEDVLRMQEQFAGLDHVVTGWVISEMSQADSLAAGEVYLDGITNIINQPEFSTSEEARRGLRLLEERSLLQDLISRTLVNSTVGGVQVLIGGEGAHEELRQCSIILSRYGVPGLATGTLGVLGPMRMSYGRSISAVRFISGLLSDMVVETLGE